jgi:hypothetical protein
MPAFGQLEGPRSFRPRHLLPDPSPPIHTGDLHVHPWFFENLVLVFDAIFVLENPTRNRTRVAHPRCTAASLLRDVFHPHPLFALSSAVRESRQRPVGRGSRNRRCPLFGRAIELSFGALFDRDDRLTVALLCPALALHWFCCAPQSAPNSARMCPANDASAWPFMLSAASAGPALRLLVWCEREAIWMSETSAM